jgi:hypothetical protein
MVFIMQTISSVIDVLPMLNSIVSISKENYSHQEHNFLDFQFEGGEDHPTEYKIPLRVKVEFYLHFRLSINNHQLLIIFL